MDREKALEQIKIVKNFLSQGDINFFIDFIDNNLHLFLKSQIPGNPRYVLLFGRHNHYTTSHLALEILGDAEQRVRKNIFQKLEKVSKEIFNNEKDLYVSSFWMAKQGNGAMIPEHVDNDLGTNMHYKYGGSIYLNTMIDQGKLEFPELDYIYSPEAGDLVIFPSNPSEYAHLVKEIKEDRYTLLIWVTEDEFWKL